MEFLDFDENDIYEQIVNGNMNGLFAYFRNGLIVDYAFRNEDYPKRIGKTLLEIAVEANRSDVIKQLIKRKCDANLKYIVDVDNYCYILKKYVKQDRLKLMCMYPCIVNANIELIKLLLQAGYDVNFHDDRGCTALWHAVDLNNYHMVKLFVNANGCDVNKPDRALLRPLHVAAIHGDLKIVSLLLRRGADVNALQIRGSTPLIFAIKHDWYKITRLLLLYGANPNQIGYNGHTPMSTAALWCQERGIVDMLFESGAHVNPELIQSCIDDKSSIFSLCPGLLKDMRERSQEPTTLKALCGLKIRKSCSLSEKRTTYFDKLQKLPLPKSLKNLIMLEHI